MKATCLTNHNNAMSVKSCEPQANMCKHLELITMHFHHRPNPLIVHRECVAFCSSSSCSTCWCCCIAACTKKCAVAAAYISCSTKVFPTRDSSVRFLASVGPQPRTSLNLHLFLLAGYPQSKSTQSRFAHPFYLNLPHTNQKDRKNRCF